MGGSAPLLKSAANAALKVGAAGGGAAALRLSAETSQWSSRSTADISDQLAATAATGLNCSPAGQGKKGLKGLCVSGHYVSAHAAHVNLHRVIFPNLPPLECLFGMF